MRQNPLLFLMRKTNAILPSLLWLGSAMLMAPPEVDAVAQNQFAIPPSADPGAIMNQEQRILRLRQEQPYLFRPITPEDLKPSLPEDVILFQDGVLPDQRSIQGIMRTPEGILIISPK